MKRLEITDPDSGETYTAEVHLHSCLQSDGWEKSPHFLVHEWRSVYGESAKIILKDVYGKGYDLIEINNGCSPQPLFLAKITKIELNPGDRFRKDQEEFIFVDLGTAYEYRYAVINSVSGKLTYSFRGEDEASSLLYSKGWEKL